LLAIIAMPGSHRRPQMHKPRRKKSSGESGAGPRRLNREIDPHPELDGLSLLIKNQQPGQKRGLHGENRARTKQVLFAIVAKVEVTETTIRILGDVNISRL
jgi:hypothetical protein